MVDVHLPSSERPLGMLFLDLNSYFASCEQQEQPELRGRPIIVSPVDTDSTCAIAASYEAKRYGIKTGTNVGEAKRLCPDLIVVPARPPLYVHYHERVIEAAESVLPVDKVCSIDEMQFRLIGRERQPSVAMDLGLQIKRALREQAGECLTCSVGIAPNAFLAKLATDMQKPDGLVVLQAEDIPDRLLGLKLTDFCGINRRMAARLGASGIFTVEAMFAASPQELRTAFGSVMGEKWWYSIRGYELSEEEHKRQSLSHSNVLPPEQRTLQGSKSVMLRLVSKAAARLRANGLWASGMGLGVRGAKRPWKAHTRFPATQDTVTFTEELNRLWLTCDVEVPHKVGMVFYDLHEAGEVTPSLFDEVGAREDLSRAVDTVNQKFGKNTIYLAALHEAKDTASEKIAFNKTWLFSEGKGDNQWSGGEEN